MSWLLFLDDLRNPSYVTECVKTQNSMTIARSSYEAIALMQKEGIPSFIYFDHDLGGDDTAMKVVNWIIEEDLNKNCIPSDFRFYVHSANPVGKANIEGKLEQYLQFKENLRG